jgi:hypothetical protein
MNTIPMPPYDTLAGRLIWLVNATSHGVAETKTTLETYMPFHDDVLHVLVGVLGQLIFAIALRSNVASLKPLLLVALAELANELNDAVFYFQTRGVTLWVEGIQEFVLTLALPTLLFAVARQRPDWLVRERSAADTE